MQTAALDSKAVRIYMVLTAIVICGLAAASVTVSKVVHFGLNFPFANLIFSVCTFPIIDVICELWGKKIARQTVWLAIGSQLLVVSFLQLAILAPHASFWAQQSAFQTVLAASGLVVLASTLAFITSQLLDVLIYQHIKKASNGKWLWLRNNVSTFIGQFVDSTILISIVFHASNNKLELLTGSFIVKMTISIAMTPVVYGLVIWINKALNGETQAFKADQHA